MKPFIYNFLDTPHYDDHEGLNLIEYSPDLNLSVLKTTKEPAIALYTLSTNTFRKGEGGGSDTDRNDMIVKPAHAMMGTQTATRANIEGSDSDFNRSANAVKSMTETSTMTFTGSGEPSDADHQKLFMMLSTRTITESKETTDSDS